VAAGAQMSVSGSVEGDVVASGGTVIISGTVGGDVRLGAGRLVIGGDVGEDALVAAGELTLADGGRIGEDLIFTAGEASVAGDVDGSIRGNAGDYERAGSVAGDESVRIGERDRERERRATPAERIVDAARHYVAVIVLGGLWVWLAPRSLAAGETTLRRRPLASLGFGLLGLVTFLAAAIVLIVVAVLLGILCGLLTLGSLAAVVVVGALLGEVLAWFAMFVFAAFLSDALAGLALASLLTSGWTDRWRQLVLLATGSLVVVVVTNLPFVGGWLKLLVIALALGALVVATWTRWRSRRAVAPTVAVPDVASAADATG
ncbi:MAG: DUF4231 domain-containing protein, partial [Chloroflexota bacterium]|nr:DUF4231 domain-containing protein [Chloroflexota bacterium]